MDSKKKTFRNYLNRFLSFLLTLCMVVGMMPEAVKAADVDDTYANGYKVNGVLLKNNTTKENPQIEYGWTWNAQDEILTFQKSIKLQDITLPDNGICTMVIPGGVRVEVNGIDKDAISGTSLKIVGNGSLFLFGINHKPLVLNGCLTIGETEGDHANETPFVNCAGQHGEIEVRGVGVSQSGHMTSIFLKKGQLSLETGRPTLGSVKYPGKIRIENDAVLLYTDALSGLNFAGSSNDYTQVIDIDHTEYFPDHGSIYRGNPSQYYTVTYTNSGFVATYNDGTYTLTGDRIGGEIPNKNTIWTSTGSNVDLSVAVAPAYGKYFVGWTTDKKTDIYQKGDEMKIGGHTTLMPVFCNVVPLEKVDIDYSKAQLTVPLPTLPDAYYTVKCFTNNNRVYTKAIELKDGTTNDGDFIIDLNKLVENNESVYDLNRLEIAQTQRLSESHNEQNVSELKTIIMNPRPAAPYLNDNAIYDPDNGFLVSIQQASKISPYVQFDGWANIDEDPSKYEFQCPDSDIWESSDYIHIPMEKDDKVLKIRKKATKDSWASVILTITLYGVKEDTPNSNYNYKTSELSGLSTGEYIITIDGKTTDVTVNAENDGKVKVDITNTTKEISIVRKGTETTNNSDPQIISLLPPSEAPALDLFETYEKDGVAYVSIPDAYEYRMKTVEGWSDWADVREVEIGADDIIEIRKSVTDDAPASLSVSFMLQPKITIDYAAETLTGFKAGSTYEITKDDETISVTPESDSIALDDSYFGKTIYVMRKGADGYPDSKSCELSIPKRPDVNINTADVQSYFVPTEDHFVLNYDIAAGYQYRVGETGEWANTPASVMVNMGGILYIRNAATTDDFASVTSDGYKGNAKEFTPKASINYGTQRFTNLAANAAYAFSVITEDGTIRVIDGTFQTNEDGELEFALDSYYGKTIFVTKKGIEATTVDSDSQVLVIKTKLPAPETDLFEIKTVKDEIMISVKESGFAYSTDEGNTWSPINRNSFLIDRGTDVLIRKDGTEDQPMSETILLHTTPEATPEAGINYTTEKLTGLAENTKYEITVDDKTIILSDELGQISLEPYYGKTISVVKKGIVGTTSDSDAQTISVKEKSEAPDRSQFEITTNDDKVMFNSVPEGYEYSTDNGETWTPANGNEFVTGRNQDVFIRKAGTETEPPSYAVLIQTSAEKTPEVEINYVTETLMRLIPNAEYEITADEKTTVTADEFGLIPLEPYYGKTIFVVKKNKDGSLLDSDKQTLTVAAKSEAPDKDAFNVEEKADTIIITANETGYEYSLDNGNTWKPVEKNGFLMDKGDDVLIRKAGTENTPTSKAVLLQTTPEVTPEAEINYASEKLTGLIANAKYEITADEKEIITADEFGQISLTSYYGKTISVVKKGDAGTTSDSNKQTLVVKQKTEAPDINMFKILTNVDKVIISAVPDGYEYSTDEGNTWKSIQENGFIIDRNVDVLIRKAGTKDEPMSNAATIKTVPEKTPEVEIDYVAEKLTGLTANAEYEITADEKVTIKANKLGQISLEPYYGKTIQIVKKGNGGVTADSDAQTLTVKAKGKAPENQFTIKTDADMVIIGSVPNGYEYSMDGGKTWKSVDRNGIIINKGDDVLIRKAGTENEPATNAVMIQTTPEKTPEATVNYVLEKLTGLTANAVYEITTDETVTFTADEFGQIPLDSYYGKTISIVKKGDMGNSLDSDIQTLTVAAKGTAPNTDAFELEMSEDGNVVISSVPEGYEYSMDNGDTWNVVPEDGTVTLEIGKEVFFRIHGTEDTPASEAVKVVITLETEPEATVDYTTEELTGLTENAEYEIIVDDVTNTVTASAAGTISLTPYYGKTITIKKKGDGKTTMDSPAQTIMVDEKVQTPDTETPDKDATPALTPSKAPSENSFDTKVDGDNITIKNITPDKEYSIDNGKTWKVGTGKDLVVTAGTKVLVRTKATDKFAASTPIVINTVTKMLTVNTITKRIGSTNTDKKDVSGSTFRSLKLKGTGKATSVKLTWKKVKGASKYIVFGSACGKKMKKLKTVKGSKSSYTNKKLKAGKFYKYMVIAYKTVDNENVVLATSKSVHVSTTKNAKYGNPKSVKIKTSKSKVKKSSSKNVQAAASKPTTSKSTTSKSIVKKSSSKKVKVNTSKITLKKGKSKTLKATYTLTKAKTKTHIAKFRYESSNTTVATVSKKGKVKGKNAGKATIYIYAQNGVYAKVNVTVK